MATRRAIASIALILALSNAAAFGAEPEATLKIRADQAGAQINPNMWGLFFEDINFAADGGLYAELVKNRSFEFPDALMGWSKTPEDSTAIEVRQDNPSSATQPHFLRIKRAAASSPLAISN